MFREWRELEPRAPSARARAATVAVKENAETEAIAAALASSRQKRWLANNPARGSLSAVKSRLSRKGLVDVVGNAIYHDPGYQSKRGEAPRSDRDADAILGLANVAADAAEARQRDAEIGLDATRADQRLIGRVAPSVAALWKGVDVDEFHDALVKERLVEWLFPSKTYAMINGLFGTVGGWSDAGDSLVILDAEMLASEVIPQYFKHNNFSSFVSQLKKYGFRNLFADRNRAHSMPPRWEFKHVNFRRGRPELLVQIRRAEHYDYASPDVAAQRQRQLELEREVGELRGTVATLQRQIDRILNRLPPDPEHYAATAPALPLDPLAGFADEPGAPLGSPRPAKRARSGSARDFDAGLARLSAPLPVPDVGALGYAPHSLDGAALHDPLLEAIPADARHLEGAALRRVETAGHGADLEGRPLVKATSQASSAQPLLTSFETARLDSLIRTLSDERVEQNDNAGA